MKFFSKKPALHREIASILNIYPLKMNIYSILGESCLTKPEKIWNIYAERIKGSVTMMTQTAPLAVLEETIEDAVTEQEDDAVFHSGKVYCANCIHCKLVPSIQNDEGLYVLRIRCNAGKWKKKLGEEKIYKYCTITRRYLDACDSYEEMGDTRTFMRDLKKTLPSKDEYYSPGVASCAP
jgi:hypothetical protein